MKKAFVLLAIVGVLFFACDNGSTGDDDPPPIDNPVLYATVSPDCDTYILETENSSRNVRVLTEGLVYNFTVIYTSKNGTPGDVAQFDPKITITVTAISKENLGQSGKEKWTLKRLDDEKIIYVTFENGAITNINGPGIQGNVYADNDAFIPFINKASSLDGAWFGYNSGGTISNTTIIDGMMYIISPDQPDVKDRIIRSDITAENFILKATNSHYWDSVSETWKLTASEQNFECPYELSVDGNNFTGFWSTLDPSLPDLSFARVLID